MPFRYNYCRQNIENYFLSLGRYIKHTDLTFKFLCVADLKVIFDYSTSSLYVSQVCFHHQLFIGVLSSLILKALPGCLVSCLYFGLIIEEEETCFSLLTVV